MANGLLCLLFVSYMGYYLNLWFIRSSQACLYRRPAKRVCMCSSGIQVSCEFGPTNLLKLYIFFFLALFLLESLYLCQHGRYTPTTIVWSWSFRSLSSRLSRTFVELLRYHRWFYCETHRWFHFRFTSSAAARTCDAILFRLWYQGRKTGLKNVQAWEIKHEAYVMQTEPRRSP